MGTADQNNDNAPIAFVLVVAAGLSTCLGAAIVFNTRLVSGRYFSVGTGVTEGGRGWLGEGTLLLQKH